MATILDMPFFHNKVVTDMIYLRKCAWDARRFIVEESLPAPGVTGLSASHLTFK